MATLFFTHCTKTKDDALKGTGKKVGPCKLYTASLVQNFCRACGLSKVRFAIFSDLHGFVFPEDEIEWYDKSPYELLDSEVERKELFQKGLATLHNYEVAYFYHLPEETRSLNPLYRRFVQDMTSKGIRIMEFTNLSLIERLAKEPAK